MANSGMVDGCTPLRAEHSGARYGSQTSVPAIVFRLTWVSTQRQTNKLVTHKNSLSLCNTCNEHTHCFCLVCLLEGNVYTYPPVNIQTMEPHHANYESGWALRWQLPSLGCLCLLFPDSPDTCNYKVQTWLFFFS